MEINAELPIPPQQRQRADDDGWKTTTTTAPVAMSQWSPASVAMAIADVFSKNGYIVPNKIAKILKIFDGLETLKSRWVIPLH